MVTFLSSVTYLILTLW